jgi:hypothetical protein
MGFEGRGDFVWSPPPPSASHDRAAPLEAGPGTLMRRHEQAACLETEPLPCRLLAPLTTVVVVVTIWDYHHKGGDIYGGTESVNVQVTTSERRPSRC